MAITSEIDKTALSGCTTGTTNNECSIYYSNKIFDNTVMIDGLGYIWTNEIDGKINMPTTDGTALMTGNTEKGYAKITYLGDNF